MAAEHPGPDPRTLWREQEQETDAVTLDQIHALVSRYDRKMRFFPLIVAVSLVIVGLIGGHQWAGAHDTLDRVLAVLFILGEAGAFIVGYRMAFPRRDPSERFGAYLRRRLQLKLAHLPGADGSWPSWRPYCRSCSCCSTRWPSVREALRAAGPAEPPFVVGAVGLLWRGRLPGPAAQSGRRDSQGRAR